MFSVNKNKIFYVLGAVLIIIIGVFSVWFLNSPEPVQNIPVVGQQNYNTAQNIQTVQSVQIGKATIKVELATTTAEQIQGLSGRTSLAANTGMLFIFDHPAFWGIWMKDMNFPIDVLWITDDLKINYIVEDMTPASYPQDYVSKTPARYVLELPVGTVKNDGIAVGQSVIFK